MSVSYADDLLPLQRGGADFGLDVSELDFVVRLSDLEEDTSRLINILKPLLNVDTNITPEVTKMTQGTINHAYKVKYGETTLMLRVFGSSVADMVTDRQRELFLLALGTRYHFGPALHFTFKNGFVMEFLKGRMLEPYELYDPFYVQKIAQTMATWHSLKLTDTEKKSVDANSWRFMDKWIKLLPEFKLTCDDTIKEIYWLREQLDIPEYSNDVVFCQNDVNSGNCIYDEQRGVIFIDYEFSGVNVRYFDIANHFCEYAGLNLNWQNYPSEQQQKSFIKHYLHALQPHMSEEDLDTQGENIRLKVDKYQLVSHIFWTLWGQIMNSAMDTEVFDYKTYAEKRFAQYQLVKARVFPHSKQ